MTDFETIIDFGSSNIKLGIFNKESKNIYSSEQKISDNGEKSLNNLIKDAEKFLSKHIDDVVVLYDTPKFLPADILTLKLPSSVSEKIFLTSGIIYRSSSQKSITRLS